MPNVSKLMRSSLTTTYLNPLDIPEILKLVFSNVNSLTALKNIRTVNKLWRWESMDQLKRTAVLFLKEETVKGLFNAHLNKNEGELPEGEFKSFFYQISEKPFESYRVPYDRADGDNAFTSLPDAPLPLMKSAESLIWDVYFSRATFLDLGMIYFDNNADIYAGFEELKWILKKCPSLKVLDIDPHIVPEDNYDDVDEIEQQRPHFPYMQIHLRGNEARKAAEAEGWGSDEILAPSLESLSIGKSCDRFVEHYHSLLSKEGRAFNTFRRLFKGCPKLKNLWTQSTSYLFGDNLPVIKAAKENLIQLESLSLVSLPWEEFKLFDVADYLKTVSAPLKTLVLTIDWSECLTMFGLTVVLQEISGTLTRLELFIDSNKPKSYAKCGVEYQFRDDAHKQKIDLTNLRWWEIPFPNLTHLKISICYTRFEGKGKDNLLPFEFRSFPLMKKLQEFRYESGLNVEKSWVTKHVSIRDLPVSFGEGEPVTGLKLFHYHKKFSCKALQRLGEWMPELDNLGLVLDKETFGKVLKIWPGLKQITLLPCSDVPKEVYEVKEGLVVIDQSEDYLPAERKSPSPESRTFEPGSDFFYDRRRLSCFRTKAHNLINY